MTVVCDGPARLFIENIRETRHRIFLLSECVEIDWLSADYFFIKVKSDKFTTHAQGWRNRFQIVVCTMYYVYRDSGG